MKILITGGAGYLGSVIVDKMLKVGYEVVVLDKLLFNQTSLLQYTSNPKFKHELTKLADSFDKKLNELNEIRQQLKNLLNDIE